ncbi:16222_t:CDS:2, partial [Racocetra persica]
MEITTISNNEIKPPRRIINACNTCREPIYEGEPIYSSSRDKQTGKSGGLYGGAGGQVPLMSSQGGVGGGVYGGSFGSDTSGEIQWELVIIGKEKLPKIECNATGAATWAYLHFREENARKANFNFRGLLDKKIPEE